MEVYSNKGFKFEPYVCNGCHDLMQKAMNFNVAIVSVKGSCYRIHFWYMTKNDAISIIENYDLNKKVDYYNFFSCLGIRKTNTYYQRIKEPLLKRAKKYYENNKERLQQQARNKYRELSNDENNITREYRRNIKIFSKR